MYQNRISETTICNIELCAIAAASPIPLIVDPSFCYWNFRMNTLEYISAYYIWLYISLSYRCDFLLIFLLFVALLPLTRSSYGFVIHFTCKKAKRCALRIFRGERIKCNKVEGIFCSGLTSRLIRWWFSLKPLLRGGTAFIQMIGEGIYRVVFICIDFLFKNENRIKWRIGLFLSFAISMFIRDDCVRMWNYYILFQYFHPVFHIYIFSEERKIMSKWSWILYPFVNFFFVSICVWSFDDFLISANAFLQLHSC